MILNTDIIKKYVNIKLEKGRRLAESLARVCFFLFPLFGNKRHKNLVKGKW